MKKIAIYCRVSSSEQNCDRQEFDLREYAEASNYQVVGVWKETAPGTSPLKVRKELIGIAKKRKIEAILVTELTRWGRSTIDLIQTLNQLSSWNISLLTMTAWEYDLSTPHGKLIAMNMAALAEFERDLLSERVKSGLRCAKAKGKKLGRPKGGRAVEKYKAKVVPLLGTMSYREISQKFSISKDTVGKIKARYG